MAAYVVALFGVVQPQGAGEAHQIEIFYCL